MKIESIEIASFKGITDSIKLDISEKNLLLYGDNGSGKSSLFEAIKLSFYYKELRKNVIQRASDSKEESVLANEWLKSYQNSKIALPISVKINNIDYDSLTPSDTDVFMLASEDVNGGLSELSLKELVECKFYPRLSSDFLNVFSKDLIDEVNTVLKDTFYSPIQLELDGSLNYVLIVKDANRNLRYAKALTNYFNEASLRLIRLLIKLHIAWLVSDKTHDRILILDDVVSSLDQANRSFFIKFLSDRFSDFQKFIFTHNVSYFNIFQSYVKTVSRDEDKWLNQLVYIAEDKVKVSESNPYNKVADICKKYNKHIISDADIGNVIRQHFEVQVYELASYLDMTSVNDSKNILNRVLKKSGNCIYLKYKYHYGYLRSEDLLQEIKDILDDGSIASPADKLAKINNHYNEFDSGDGMKVIIPILREVRLYQKLVLHQLSHGHAGLPAYSRAEIMRCLDLMQLLENNLNDLRKNISGV